MENAPLLTDRKALERQRERAKHDLVTFLFDVATDEIKDRLSMVNRTFTKSVMVSGFPSLWNGSFPDFVHLLDDETLMLDGSGFDLAVHTLALHWANDPVGQMIQLRRALKKDGMFLGVLFGGQTLWELRSCLATAEAEIVGGLSPRVAPMAEIRDLGGLLQRAGFALPVADSIPLNVTYPSFFALLRDLRGMGEGNALNDRLRRPTQRGVFTRAAEIYHENYADKDGRLSATFELIFLSGWAPDESQPKPLRPGSAVARLSDALGTQEKSLSD